MDATSWWTAAEAKENGFIDEITESNQTAKIENRNGALFVNSIAVPGTFDDAPEFVRNRAVVAPATTEGFVNNTDPAGKPDKNDGGNDMEFKNADELRNGCPDLVKEIVDEAHAEAQKQERDRLAAIDEIADAVPSDLVAEAKYGDKACSAEQLAYRAALDAKKKGHKLLDDTEDDADTSGANSVGGAAPGRCLWHWHEEQEPDRRRKRVRWSRTCSTRRRRAKRWLKKLLSEKLGEVEYDGLIAGVNPKKARRPLA